MTQLIKAIAYEVSFQKHRERRPYIQDTHASRARFAFAPIWF